MADDKYVGLIDVTKALQDVTRLMERRETLLEMMFRDDRYQDFLQQEDEQDTLPGEDDSGVSSPSGGSKVSDLLPALFSTVSSMFNRDDDDAGEGAPTQKFKDGGVVGTSPMMPGMLSSPSQTNPTGTTSLEKSGFDDTFLKNISNKLEDDFDLDPMVKKGFGQALSMPARAAAAHLVDLMSKIPAQTPEQKQIIKNNIQDIANAYGLNKATVITKMESNMREQNIFEKIGGFFRGILPNAPSGPPGPPGPPGDTPPSGDPNAASAAPATGAGGLLQSYSNTVNSVNNTVKGLLGIKTEDTETKPSTESTTGATKEQVGDLGSGKAKPIPVESLAGNTPGEEQKQSPVAAYSSFVNSVNNTFSSFSKMFGGGAADAPAAPVQTSAAIDPAAAPSTNLSELTEKTITENRQMQQEKVELASAKLQAPAAPLPATGTTSSSLNEMGDSASQDTRRSPFFEVYANSSQYG